jgi:gliding motility-associated-like protein
MRILTFCFFILSCAAIAQKPFLLIPNEGQWHDEVLYKSKLPGGSYFITKTGFTYSLYEENVLLDLHNGEKVEGMKAHAVKVNFIGAQEPSSKILQNTESQTFNYLLGKDRSKWKTGLNGGLDVILKDIYPGIDIHYTVALNRIKYELIVNPGADPSIIKLKIDGADKAKIVRGGLRITTSLGEILDSPPLVYQGRSDVISSEYKLNNNILSFELGEYDKSEKLIIDPEIVFSSYSGSSALNFGFTATYDDLGFLYAGGSVFSDGYPITTGAYDITFNSYRSQECSFFTCWGVADMAISKYDTSGTKLIYSTYIGGELSELPHSLIVNDAGELYVYGTTGSAEYPTTVDAYDSTFAGGSGANLANGIYVNYYNGVDIVISKLNSDGNQLLASTYLGGTGNDGLNLNPNLTYNYADQVRGEIILNSEDEPIIASSTFSSDYPITVGVFNPTFSGNQDGVISKLSPDLKTLTWSSYYGGNQGDAIYSIEVGNNDNLYIAGGTNSTNIEVTDSAYQSTFAGGRADGFMAIINEDGDDLIYSSYYGTDAYDQIYFIRTDFLDNVYVYGQTEKYGTDYIFNAAYNIPNSGQFISKFNPKVNALTWSTVFGSGDNKVNISPTAFAVDLCNRVYLSGWGSPSSSFNGINTNGAKGTVGMQVTADAFQSTTDNSDFYMMVLEDDASTLTYATYFGGNLSSEHVDGGTSRFDKKGHIYQSMCAGCGGNSDMPIFPANAHSPTNNSNCNNGVLKFDFDFPNVIADFILPEPGCANFEYEFINNSKTLGSTTFEWNFGDGNTSNEKNPKHTYLTSGSFNVSLKLIDSTSCNLEDSAVKTLIIRVDNVTQQPEDTICYGETITLAENFDFEPGRLFDWNPGILLSDSTILSPNHDVDSTVNLDLIVNYRGCNDTIRFPIYVPEATNFTDSIYACLGDTQNISSSAAVYSPIIISSNRLISDTLNNYPINDSINHIFNDSTWYYVNYTKEGCSFIDSIYAIPRFINQLVDADSIVCSSDSIFRQIFQPVESEISSTVWSPDAFTFNETKTSAWLLPYDYLSVFEVTVTDIYGCVYDNEIRLLDNSLNIDLNDTTICEGDTLEIGFELNYNANYTYSWLPSNGINNPDSLLTYGVFNDTTELQLIVDNSFCVDTTNKLINVVKYPNKFLPNDTLVCNFSDLMTFEVNPKYSGEYTWFVNNQIQNTSQDDFDLSTVLAEGNNTIHFIGTDAIGCSFSDTINAFNSLIEVNLPSDTILCTDDTLNIFSDATSTSQIKYGWEPYAIFLNDTTSDFARIYFNSGNQTLRVMVRNEENCKDTAEIIIRKPNLASTSLSLSISPNKIATNESTLVTVTPTDYEVFWQPIQPTSQSFNNYTFTNPKTGYIIGTITDTTYNYCTKTDSVYLEVVEVECGPPYIFVPNAFTPNNDGENDELFVRGRNITKMYFAVFNRWGQKVFETNDINIGWNGYFNGMKADPGVFDYYLEYECEPNKQQFLKGNVTLIR